MRLLAKFNVVLVLVFGVGMLVSGYLSRSFLQDNARNDVLQQARLMMEAAGGMRTYTSKQVRPLLEAHQMHTSMFMPQTVPAYGATEVFNYLRAGYPAYNYKEATLNPTNPRDRAADWEADVIQALRNHPNRNEMVGERDTPEGRSLFLAKPIRVTADCLECHSTPDAAPAAMLKTYGRDNGFNWQEGDVIAAQIVSVPMSVPLAIAKRAFRTVIVSLAGVSLATLILFDLALITIVIRPVVRLTKAAEEISKGNLSVPEIPVQGQDEVSQLARSFNRMYLSLVKAIQLLEASEEHPQE
jgi:protein-histidine pros-kinase